MTCTHYWVFDPPKGPTSKGVCKHCGNEIEAVNYIEFVLIGQPMNKNRPEAEKQYPLASNGVDGEGIEG